MAWVSIDDQFHDHPKAEQVGPLGRDLYVAGLEYANRNLTDGFVPKATAGRLVSFYDIPGINVTVDPYDVVKLLLEVGLWDAVDGGFEIHDYLEYQPSADEVSHRRNLKRERQQRWREKQDSDTTSTYNEDDVTVDASTDALQVSPQDAQTQDPRPKTQVIPKKPKPKPENIAAKNAAQEKPAALVDAYCRARGQPFPNDAGTFINIAKSLHRRGYTADDIVHCTRYLMDDPYWEPKLTFKILANQLPDWLQNGRPPPRSQRPLQPTDIKNTLTRAILTTDLDDNDDKPGHLSAENGGTLGIPAQSRRLRGGE